MMDNLAWDGAEEYYTTPNEVAYVTNLLFVRCAFMPVVQLSGCCSHTAVEQAPGLI